MIVRYNMTDARFKHLQPLSVVAAPVYSFLGPDVWLAGGALVRWLEGATRNEGDFDLFTSEPQLLCERLGASGLYELSSSMLAISFTGKIQVIRRPYPSLTDVLESFDFTARMVGTDGIDVLAGKFALVDIQKKCILFNRSKKEKLSFSLTSLTGLVRYGNRGYTLDNQNAKLFLEAWECRNVLTSDY